MGCVDEGIDNYRELYGKRGHHAQPAPATIPYCDPQADVSAATRMNVRLKYHRRR